MTHPLSGGCAPATIHISGEKVFVLEFGRVRASDVIHGRVSVLQEGASAVTYQLCTIPHYVCLQIPHTEQAFCRSLFNQER